MNKLDNKELKKISIFIKQTVSEIYSHLIKSFLNGEYLIDANYSNKINQRIETIKKSSSTVQTQTILHLEKSFLKNAWLIEKTCRLIDNQINFLTESAVHIPMNREQKANIIFTIDTKFVGKNETIIYEQFLDSVVEMTLIDHSYRIKKENIKKLLLLIERANNFKKYLYDKTIIDLVLTKAYTLYESFVKLLNEENQDKYNIDINRIRHKLIVDDNNITEKDIKNYSLYNKQEINIPNFIKQQKQQKQLEPPDLKYKDSHNDIMRYNETINKGVRKYNELWQQFQNLKSYDFKKLKETIVFCERSNFQNLSHSFLFKLIDKTSTELENQIQNIKNNDKEETINDQPNIQYLLNSLNNQLIKLHSYFSFFEGTANTPHIIRPLFENSFYKLEENGKFYSLATTLNLDLYSFEEYKNTFFIASFHCIPFNIDYLKSFYKKYNQLKEQHTYEYHLLLTKYVDKTSKKTQELQTNTQKHNINLLGIFSALLAFVTVNIGMVKIADNIYEYILYVLTFVFALSFFVFLIKYETLKKQIPIFIVMFALLILVFGSYIFFDYKGYLTNQPNKEETTEKILNDYKILINNKE